MQKHNKEDKFDPYQPSVLSLGTTRAETYEGGEDSSFNYKLKLDNLLEQRNQMMSKPIRDRNLQLFQVEEEHMRHFEQMFSEEREEKEE